MKRKKILALSTMLSLAMLLGNTPSVNAAGLATEGDSQTQNTTIEFSVTGSELGGVVVQVPATINATKVDSNFEGTANVGAYGHIADDLILKVTTPTEIDLTNKSDSTLTKPKGTVTFGTNNSGVWDAVHLYGGTDLGGNSISTKEVKISTALNQAGIKVGNYSGTITFNCSIAKLPTYNLEHFNESMMYPNYKVDMTSGIEAPTGMADGVVYYIDENGAEINTNVKIQLIEATGCTDFLIPNGEGYNNIDTDSHNITKAFILDAEGNRIMKLEPRDYTVESISKVSDAEYQYSLKLDAAFESIHYSDNTDGNTKVTYKDASGQYHVVTGKSTYDSANQSIVVTVDNNYFDNSNYTLINVQLLKVTSWNDGTNTVTSTNVVRVLGF